MKNLNDCPGCGHGSYKLVEEGHVICRKCGGKYPIACLLPQEDLQELRRPGGVERLVVVVANPEGGAPYELIGEWEFTGKELRRLVDVLHRNLDPSTRDICERMIALLSFDPDGRCMICGELAGGNVRHRCK